MSTVKMLVRHRNGLFLAKGYYISGRLFIYNNRQCSKNSRKYWHIIDRTTGLSIMRYPLDRFRTKSAAISAATSEFKYMLDIIENDSSIAQKYGLAVLEYNSLIDEYNHERKEV